MMEIYEKDKLEHAKVFDETFDDPFNRIIYRSCHFNIVGAPHQKMKTIPCIALCASLLAAPVEAAEQPPRQDGAGLAVGAVVICVGGYCIYKLVKVCQKLFPKDNTNSAPGSVSFMASGEEYGGSWNYSPAGSCGDGDWELRVGSDSETNNSYVATIKVTVGEWGQVTTGISAGKNDGSQSQTWEEFQREVASHGLVVSGIGDGSKYYSRNRVPCGPESVPISFNESTHAIVHTGGSVNRMRTISIERSPDFQSWSHFLTVQSTFDSGFEVQDLTRYGQMFYRVSVQP